MKTLLPETKPRKPFYKSKIFRLISFGLLTFVIVGYVAGSIYGANYFTTPLDRTLGPYTPADLGLVSTISALKLPPAMA